MLDTPHKRGHHTILHNYNTPLTMTAMKLRFKPLLSMGIVVSILLSYCAVVEAWRAINIRIPSFTSTRREQRVFKYKQRLDEEEEHKSRPFMHPFSFKRTSTSKDDENYQDTEEYWRNKNALQVQNEVRKNRELRGRRSYDALSSYSPNLDKSLLRKQQNRTLSSSPKKPSTIVTNVHELRSAVLDQGILLKDIEFQNVSFVPRKSMNATMAAAFAAAQSPPAKKIKTDATLLTENPAPPFNPINHEVIKLIEKRARTKSKPGSRAADDTAILALSIEGGGMRGAVSAGMASAIAVLGLSDSFDSIYGSSAGSVVGAYMVSRQMCIDVYTDVLTTAKTKFVSKGRLASSIATNLLDQKVLNNTTKFSQYVSPAMNISFVLDGIMCPEKGLRPLDVEMFRTNDERQQLRVVTSTVRDGKMETHCLGSRTMDFFDKVDKETGEVLERATTMMNKDRHGLFACLETSMLVPVATGPPLTLLRHKDAHLNITTRCFDAFCYEPIPYRSAVEEGATHVLVLKTRPDAKPIGTKPGLFEKVFAPMYFDTNGLPEVAKYFENGGQQYIYTEDYLTLDEGKAHVVDKNDASTCDGVLVPPRKILYGIDRDDEANELATNRDEWKRAHLFPLAVPEGKPQLSVLSVDQDEVLEGVRNGFAAAFNLLAPVANVELNSHLDGDRVAELLFSHVGSAINVLANPVSVAGDFIWDSADSPSTLEKAAQLDLRTSYFMHELELAQEVRMKDGPCSKQDASELLNSLPGFNYGRMVSLSKGLYQLKEGV